MEPTGAERHRRSPEGEVAGASESIEPARGMKALLSNNSRTTNRWAFPSSKPGITR